ncbi:MAG: tRNA (N(6)-L-threonylcarbamoyladenosine(37)-C(2))-methylthiotransferase [Candidatus Bathyarchaeota archaeon]|nr:tRNA (N(6)-L-threonylcarbamoyladenosine(37)-C(2))-methylthiotransferase [Candidatus Bathyarchaeota archaeon]
MLHQPVNINIPDITFIAKTMQLPTEPPMHHIIHIKNYGCSSNTADGETLSGCLTQAGYTLTPNETQANLIIYNTCAVKGPTENHIINDIKIAPPDKKILITGCLPKISFERLLKEVRFDAAIGPAPGQTIVDIVKRVLSGEQVVDLTNGQDKPSLNLPRVTSNPLVSIIPINYGCLGSCAYCCVVHARGHLRSYPQKEIIHRIKSDLAAGVKEFWVTSQDTAAYGLDIGTDLAELLAKIGLVAGDFHVRVGMMTPNLVTDIQNRLIEAFDSPKIFQFLHLPVQSGDDMVLQYMHRFYSATEFEGIIDTFRVDFPELTLATDVIVGFPGETEEAFENTLLLLEKTKPDIINVSKFFVRPKTFAVNLSEGLVDKEEIKRRSVVASELAKRLSAERNQRWLGWSGEVFVDEQGKLEGSWVGRNFAYKPIVVESCQNLLGKTLHVTIKEAAGTYLKATIDDA